MDDERIGELKRHMGDGAMATMDLMEMDGVAEAVERAVEGLAELESTLTACGAERRQRLILMAGLVLSAALDRD